MKTRTVAKKPPAVVPQAGNLPNSPVVGVAGTADGRGFWEVTAAGSVYAVGDAASLSTSTVAPVTPITGATGDPAPGGGYWMVSADGGVFAVGSPFHGAG